MTYKYLQAITAGKSFPIAGTNSDGEKVIIRRGKAFFKLSTMQRNGWVRHNIIHEDGTAEELYEK